MLFKLSVVVLTNWQTCRVNENRLYSASWQYSKGSLICESFLVQIKSQSIRKFKGTELVDVCWRVNRQVLSNLKMAVNCNFIFAHSCRHNCELNNCRHYS